LRTSTTGFAALLLGLACTACRSPADEPPAAAGESCELRVAWDPYEPYSWKESAEGPPLGYDIDVVTKVSDMIGCSLAFREMPWSDILVALREGQVDLTVGTGYKPDRAAWSRYSESYRKEIIGLLVRAGSSAEFTGASLAEVFGRGLVFGKTIDDTYDGDTLAVFDRHPGQVREPASESANIERLLEGAIDGFLIEVNVAAALMRKAGVAGQLEFHPLSFDAGAYRLQMSRKTVPADLVTRIDGAIQQLAFDGWFDELNARYRQ
jgi:ABC-type amino acid transport substrate-binding protein